MLVNGQGLTEIDEGRRKRAENIKAQNEEAAKQSAASAEAKTEDVVKVSSTNPVRA
jgi:hypothetical protein